MTGPDYIRFSEEELLDARHLSYNPHSVLATPSAMIPCLRKQVREINLVHYQGEAPRRGRRPSSCSPTRRWSISCGAGSPRAPCGPRFS